MPPSKSSAWRRVGRVSILRLYLYYTLDGRAVRRRVKGDEAQAEIAASLVNAKLVAAEAGSTVPSVDDATVPEIRRPLDVADLRESSSNITSRRAERVTHACPNDRRALADAGGEHQPVQPARARS